GLGREEWCQPTLDLSAQKYLQTLPYLFACLAFYKVVGQWIYAWAEQLTSCHQSADRATAPAQHSVWVDLENLVCIACKALYPGSYFLAQHATCGGDQGPRLGAVNRVRHEVQSVESADVSPLDTHLTNVRHRGQ